jgi:hypothetical protein
MMTTEIRITADEAKRLKADTAFLLFCDKVREEQHRIFADSSAEDVSAREQAHAILRALNQITSKLDTAIAEEKMLDRKLKG